MGEPDRTKWDARYSHEAPSDVPSPWLLAWFGVWGEGRLWRPEAPNGQPGKADESVVPKSGRVLDVAGGAGRNAIWFAQRGFDVTLVDISPVGIALAEERAKAAGVTITTRLLDLESEPLPDGPWDVIVQMHYLERALFSQYARLLAPSGLLFVEHPTRSNLVRHAKPGPAYLLEDGELPDLCVDFVIVSYGEGWNEAGKHEARLVARRIGGACGTG